MQIKDDVGRQKVMVLQISGEGILRYQGILCVPQVDGLRGRILAESHKSRYTGHPSLTKMYHDLREIYWRNNLKRHVVSK